MQEKAGFYFLRNSFPGFVIGFWAAWAFGADAVSIGYNGPPLQD